MARSSDYVLREVGIYLGDLSKCWLIIFSLQKVAFDGRLKNGPGWEARKEYL